MKLDFFFHNGSYFLCSKVILDVYVACCPVSELPHDEEKTKAGGLKCARRNIYVFTYLIFRFAALIDKLI